MDAPLAAAILEAVTQAPMSIRAIAKASRRRTATVTAALAEMEEKGLLERRAERNAARGRPREMIAATPLGSEYLRSYRALRLIPLTSSPEAIRRAAEEGRYAARLASRGADPFRLFLELSEYVRAAASPP